MATKEIILSYLERNIIVKVGDSDMCKGSELRYLEDCFRKLSNYQANVDINISFHKFNTDWNEFIELDDKAVLCKTN